MGHYNFLALEIAILLFTHSYILSMTMTQRKVSFFLGKKKLIFSSLLRAQTPPSSLILFHTQRTCNGNNIKQCVWNNMDCWRSRKKQFSFHEFLSLSCLFIDAELTFCGGIWIFFFEVFDFKEAKLPSNFSPFSNNGALMFCFSYKKCHYLTNQILL